MRTLLVPEEKLQYEREQYFTSEELEFLKQKDLLRRSRDYAIFPAKFHRIHRTENIVIHKLFVQSFDFYQFISELLSELTPPFSILCDCSFIIKKPVNDELRFVFSQRSTSFDTKRMITKDKDIDTVLDFFKNKSNFELLQHASDNHRRQACFDESGFNASKLVCACFFLSKISTLNAPIPFQ